MITGFITTAVVAQSINSAIAAAEQEDWGSVYWLPGEFPILSGPHAGGTFIPFDDESMGTVLRKGKTVAQFPQFPQLVAALGGLESRVGIDPSDLVDQNAVP